MPSLSAYLLSWVSLTLDVGFLFMAAPAKHSHCSLLRTWGSSSQLPRLCAVEAVTATTFDCVDHNKLWKILKEMGIPNYLTCLLRNL